MAIPIGHANSIISVVSTVVIQQTMINKLYRSFSSFSFDVTPYIEEILTSESIIIISNSNLIYFLHPLASSYHHETNIK